MKMEKEEVKLKELLTEEEMLDKLGQVAESKGLKVFVFKGKDLEKEYPESNPAVGVALMSKDEDSAKWNLRNLRRCLLFRIE